MILVSDILLISLAFIALVIGSITDIKKREIADWISFSLFAVALAIRGIVSLISKDPTYFLYGLLVFGILFVILVPAYYGKLFGGGDVKILLAIGACLATTPVFLTKLSVFSFSTPFIVSLIINGLIIGSLQGIIWGFVTLCKKPDKWCFSFKTTFKKNRKIIYSSGILALLFLIAIIVFKEPILLITFVMLILLPVLFAFAKASEDTGFIKLKSPNQLTEGDSLTKEVKIGSKTLKQTADGLTKKDILLLKKFNKKVLITDGLPYIPALLLALILTFLFDNILLRIISMLI
ncbi:MAG: A24 family peptidase [archaeon]